MYLRTRVILPALALALFASRLGAATITFSLDIASPSLLLGFHASDILVPGPTPFIPGSSLGLSAADSFGDFSFGNDPIMPPLYFSVDRVAVGLPRSDVYANSAAGGANGSVYQAPPPSGSNRTHLSSGALGLIGGLFGDDVHGLSLMPYTGNVYFTLEPGSPSLAGRSGADIFLNSPANLFASYATMGLQAGDAIDGLVLCHLCNAGIDEALFSISTFSPSSTLMGGSIRPGDIYLTRFQGSSSLFASASSLGLRDDDELHALATVPEPSSFALMGIGCALIGGSAILRRRCHTRALTLLLAVCSVVLPLAARDRRDFCGTDPALNTNSSSFDSIGTLMLPDVSSDKKFRWISKDRSLGQIDTGLVTADTWQKAGQNPARLVFTGNGNGIKIEGNVILEPSNRGVVTAFVNGKRARYAIVAAKKLALGGSLDSNRNCFRVYMPDKYGGKLSIKTTGGTITNLRYPDLSDYTNAAETGEDRHGWYTFLIPDADGFTVAATFNQQGEASKRPWNYYWWSSKADYIREPLVGGNGKSDTTAAATDVQVIAKDAAAAPGADIVLSGDDGTLETVPGGDDEKRVILNLFDKEGAYQPLVRYDARNATVARNWEAKNHQGRFEWCGHCLGGAIASIKLKVPKPKAGSGYNDEELKGLWQELGENGNHTYPDEVGPIPAGPPDAGADAVDKYAPDYHRILAAYVKSAKEPLYSDLRSESGAADEVWNHAVFKFTADFSEAPGGEEKVVRIKTKITANQDHTPPTDDLQTREVEYEYIITYKASGLPDPAAAAKKDWIKVGGAAKYAPRWLSRVGTPSWAGKNPHVTEANVRKDDTANP